PARPPSSPRFPYTTLFRSVGAAPHLDAGVRHREQVGLVEDELGVDLVVELVAGAADPLAERVAALQHELLDDAVEDDAVVERLRDRKSTRLNSSHVKISYA